MASLAPPALAVFGGVVAACFLAFPRDDAFITFRYAERLAAGLGLTYQDGPPVIGTSTPLWTLILAAAARCGLPVGLAAAWLGVLLYAISIGILGRTLERYCDLPTAWFAAALLALNPPSVAIAASGMESALVGFLVTAGLATVVFQKPMWGSAIAGLLLLTRIDLLPLACLILAAHCWSSPRGCRRNLLLFTAISAPWFLWAWSTTGSPLPHSIPAKLTYYAGRDWSNSHVASRWAIDDPLRATLCLLGLVGTLKMVRNPVVILAAWPIIHLGALATSGTWIHEWYLTPLYPVLFFFAAIGVRSLIPHGRGHSWILGLTTGIVLIVGGQRVRSAHGAWSEATQDFLDCHGKVADYLGTHRRPGESVACGDIGLIGYRTGAPVLDTVGLVSPSVLPFLAKDDPASIYRVLRPEWVIIGTYGPDHERVLADPDFLRNYSEMVQFFHGPDRAYIVFRLKDA